jgi:hypothetical protein
MGIACGRIAVGVDDSRLTLEALKSRYATKR